MTNKAHLIQRLVVPKEVVINQQPYLFREIGYQHVKELMTLQKKVYNGRIPWSRPAFLEEMNGVEPVFYMMLQVDKKAVAFITVCFADGVGQISNVVVSPAYQGQGLGKFLIAEAKEMAKIYQVSALTLEVRVSNQRAQQLYLSSGFSQLETIENYYYKEKEAAHKMRFDFKEEDKDDGK